MGNAVGWFSIQGKDSDELVQFYRKVFDWKMGPSPDGGKMVAPEEGGIPGGVGPSRDGKPHVSVYVAVKSVTRFLTKVTKMGGQSAMPKTKLPDNMGFIAGFIDPAGNWVGLWEPSQSGAGAAKPKATKRKATKRKAAKKRVVKKRTASKKTGSQKAKPSKRATSKKAGSRKTKSSKRATSKKSASRKTKSSKRTASKKSGPGKKRASKKRGRSKATA